MIYRKLLLSIIIIAFKRLKFEQIYSQKDCLSENTLRNIKFMRLFNNITVKIHLN